MTFRERVTLAVRSVEFDLRVATRHFFRNTLPSSVFVPRIVRFLLYRATGVRTQTPNIAENVTIGCLARMLSVAPEVTISRDCVFEGSGRISIEQGALIGHGVSFITSNHNLGPGGRVDRTPVYRDIVVGEHAWVGAKSVILGGADIGERCVIMAGSVVSSRCEPGNVYAGVPARKIGPAKALAVGT